MAFTVIQYCVKIMIIRQKDWMCKSLNWIECARRGHSAWDSESSSLPLSWGNNNFWWGANHPTIISIHLQPQRQIMFAEGGGRHGDSHSLEQVQQLPCMRILETEGKFSQGCTFKKAAEKELMSCLRAAACFCINKSFETSSWVSSNTSKSRTVAVTMLELYLSGIENLVQCPQSFCILLSNHKEITNFVGKKKPKPNLLFQFGVFVHFNLLLTSKYNVFLSCAM